MTTFNCQDYGAVANADRVQTRALQAAIEACRQHGGGQVLLPAGVYKTGSLRLYSGIELHLAAGAVLLGSPALTDYTDFHQHTDIAYLQVRDYIEAWHLPPNYFHALIAAYDATDVAVTGEAGSVIDGGDLVDPAGEEGFRGPMGLVFARVEGLRLSGYTVRRSSNWAHTIGACRQVTCEQITITGGHDGFDLHHSKQVTISDCHLACGDDCIAGYDVADVLITGCTLNTACNVTRLSGTNVVITDCHQKGPNRYPHRSKGSFETHALAKPYALAVDCDQRQDLALTFRRMQVHDLTRLVMYHQGDKALLQDGAPLSALTFQALDASGLATTSEILGNNQCLAVRFEHCRITPPAMQPFLLIDDAVDLNIVQTLFTEPTIIATTSGQHWQFTGLTNFSRNVLA